jgi:hypothetical protein
MTRLPAGPIAPPAAGIQLQFGPHGYPSSRAGSSASMSRLGGGRTWWAHLEFTRINIKPTIRKKEIEDVRGVGASSRLAMRRQRYGLVR